MESKLLLWASGVYTVRKKMWFQIKGTVAVLKAEQCWIGSETMHKIYPKKPVQLSKGAGPSSNFFEGKVVHEGGVEDSNLDLVNKLRHAGDNKSYSAWNC
jgi:hypothetical protein